MKKVVVLTSGGMDSTVLLYHHLKHGDRVRTISFNYGQRHHKELAFARLISIEAGLMPTEVDLSFLRLIFPGSSQMDSRVEVPQGRYDEESMKATVVPNRNMILLSIAVGFAIAHDMDFVSFAAHAGDHTIYPDCRPEFTKALQQAIGKCDWRRIQLLRPFINIPKHEIVKKGHLMGVDFRGTWSCYVGGETQCGRCGTCIERRQAFFLAEVPDPSVYSEDAPTIEQMVANDWHLTPRD